LFIQNDVAGTGTGDTVHPDLAWGYDYPVPESIRIAGLICFYNERVDLTVDGQRVARPETPRAS